MRTLLNIIATILIIAFTSIACVGSFKSHTFRMEVRAADVVAERFCEPPIYIELPPVPDYVASDKSDIYRYNPYLEWTEEEKDILVRIAQAEAGNQGTVGMALVMRVVINRVERNDTDIKTEVFRPKQFAVGGMAPGTWETYEVLDMVQTGWDESQGALFFCADGYNGPVPLFRYKDHWFSTK